MDTQKLNVFMRKVISDLGGAFSIAPVRIGGALGLYAPWPRPVLPIPSNSPRRPVLPSAMCANGSRIRPRRAMSNTILHSGRFTLPPSTPSCSPIRKARPTSSTASHGRRTLRQHAGRDGRIPHGKGRPLAGPVRVHRLLHRANSSVRAIEPTSSKAGFRHWPANSRATQVGALVADIGCGHGHSTRLMAEAFPNSRFIGIDIHAPSIEAARSHAAAHGEIVNLTFEVGNALDFRGQGLRPRDELRLPARHGKSGRSGAPRPSRCLSRTDRG